MKEISAFLSKSKCFSKFSQVLSPGSLSVLGRKVGFILRQRNLFAAAFCYVSIFCGGSSGYLSINDFRIALWDHFKIKLSKSSLFERFNARSVSMMKALFEQILAQRWTQLSDQEWLSNFSDVFVADSSIINLSNSCAALFPGFGGGASAACSKLQLMIGLLSGKFQELFLLPGRQSDTGHRFGQIQSKALYLFDLAYVNGQNFGVIIDGLAKFVCRYKYGTKLFLPCGKPFTQAELRKKIRRLKPWRRFQIDILLSEKHKTPCRLVVQKLPKEMADQIRHKLKTDKQKKCKNLSKARLEFCEVNAFLTNLSSEELPDNLIRAYYSIRWQVELIFKAWKSCFGLDKTRNVGPYQFQVCLYGYLIRIMITTRIFWAAKINLWQSHQKELSELKAFKHLAKCGEELFNLLVKKQGKIEEFLSKTYQKLALFCIKERRKKEPTPWQILAMSP